MVDEIKEPSGLPEKPPVEDTKEKHDSITYESYKKAVVEAKNAKEKERETLKELNEFRKRFKDIETAKTLEEEAKLTEKGEYQKLVQLKEEELTKYQTRVDELASERDAFRVELIDSYKMSEVEKKLPGHFKQPEYRNHLNLDSIVVDPDTGRIDDGSVDNVVASFMERHHSLLDNSKFGRLPSDAPRGSARKYSNDEWRSLSLKDKKDNWAKKPI